MKYLMAQMLFGFEAQIVVGEIVSNSFQSNDVVVLRSERAILKYFKSFMRK